MNKGQIPPQVLAGFRLLETGASHDDEPLPSAFQVSLPRHNQGVFMAAESLQTKSSWSMCLTEAQTMQS